MATKSESVSRSPAKRQKLTTVTPSSSEHSERQERARPKATLVQVVDPARPKARLVPRSKGSADTPRAKCRAAAEGGTPRVQLAPRSAVAETTVKEESAVAEKEKEHKKEKKHNKKQEKEESAVAEKDKKKKHGKEDKKGRKDEEKEISAVAEKCRKHREHKEPQEAPKAQKQEAQKAQKQAVKKEPKQALKEEPKQALKEEPKKQAKKRRWRPPKEAAKEAAKEGPSTPPNKQAPKTPPKAPKKQREPKEVRPPEHAPKGAQEEPAVAGSSDSDGSDSDEYTYSYSGSEGEPAAAAAAPSGASGAEKRAGKQPQEEPKKRAPRTPPKTKTKEPQPRTPPLKEEPQPAAAASEEAAVAAEEPQEPPPDWDRESSSSKSSSCSERSEDEDARAATVGRCEAAHKQAAALGVAAPPPAVQPQPHQQWGAAYHQHMGAYHHQWRAYHHQQQWYHQQWHASQASAQQSSAVAEGSDARSEFGVGQAQCVYVDVAEGADLPEVARDLRLQGPHILMVRCSAVEQRRQLQNMLEEEQRSSAVAEGRREVQFRCDSQGSVLVAGRDGFVSDVRVQQFLKIERVGQVTIAQFDFAVSVQHMASIKVAVVSLTPNDRGDMSSELAENWKKVVDCMARTAVRFVAGQFADRLDQFLLATRAALQARACATVHFDAHADSCEATGMFILGPVNKVKEGAEGGGYTITRGDGEISDEVKWQIEHSQACVGVGQDSYYVGPAGQDRSRGWPVIQHSKERQPQHVSEHTRKIVIFFGSTESHRSWKGREEREEKREERAEKWYGMTGKQQCWRR